MSNSYSMPLRYGPEPRPLSYENQLDEISEDNVNSTESNKNVISKTLPVVGVLAGAVIGGITGAKKNPCIVNGENINDKFATKVYERYLKKVPEAGKESYKQTKNMLKKINGIRNVDDLSTLFAENPEAADEVCSALSKEPNEFLNHVTNRNLRSNKKTIKNKLEAANKTRIQDIKNDILSYWNPDKKRFEKGTNPDKKLFRTIKTTAAEIKTGGIAKAVLIGAAIGGAALFAIGKLLGVGKNLIQKKSS